MFPPMSPLGERVRTTLENQQLERDAAARAQMTPDHRVRDVLHRLFAILFRLMSRRTSMAQTEATPQAAGEGHSSETASPDMKRMPSLKTAPKNSN